MLKMQDYKNFHFLNHLNYKDQKGLEHSLKVQVNFNNDSKILHISSCESKACNLMMDIDLNSEVEAANNMSHCNYIINYIDERKNLDGIEFGKVCISQNNLGAIKLCSLNHSFSLEQNHTF